MDGLVFAVAAIAFGILYYVEKDSFRKLLWVVSAVVLVLCSSIYNFQLCSTQSSLNVTTGITTTTYVYCTGTFQSGGAPTYFLALIALIVIIMFFLRLIQLAQEALADAKG